MCDTLCALPEWSRSSHTLLAKNSDRDPNEPHVIRAIPAMEHSPGHPLRCTYVEIPQAPHTHAVLLFKPDWIWGAEMGVNEYGVAIGNEAVFTRAKRGPAALTGMDLLRLALERSETAGQAVEVIVQLLDTYGQGGDCGYEKPFYYDNSFLIADPQRAYVLETAGKNYAAYEVDKNAAISNRLSITTEHTLRRGIEEGADFARQFTEPVFSLFAAGKDRRAQSLCALDNGPLGTADMIRALRTHAPGREGKEFTRGHVGSVCMHAGGLIGDQTTGSIVAVLRKDASMTIWATGASTPCIAAFKPLFFGVNSRAPVFETDAQGREYWLKRERLNRAVLAGKVDVKTLRERRDALEKAWLAEEESLFSSGAPDSEALADFAKRAAAEEESMIDDFSTEDWADMPGRGRFARYWRRKNATLGAGK
jgi:secernin